MSLPVFFASALFAEVVGTVTDFGSSTLFLPLALLFFDFKTALTLVAVFHVFAVLAAIAAAGLRLAFDGLAAL